MTITIPTTSSAVERTAPLLSVRGLTKTFDSLAGPLPVLEGIDLDLRPGEIVALLGKSGSGKSTLLRCIAGLIPPSEGTVHYRGAPLTGANPGAAMVFQSFALLPWLTVQQNVELGLEARGVAPTERAERALRAIDLVGLDGFESAYPKELSGGMRQRVGFARAVVVEPELLLMDEPFSALDVLTAENLRGELLELWEGGEFPIRSILVVTHNIEEAVLLADRVVVLGSNPGQIRAELRVELPRPRDRESPGFTAVVDRLYGTVTAPGQTVAGPPSRDEREIEGAAGRAPLVTSPLPHASVDGLSGLAEILLPLDTTPLATLADELGLEVDDLLPQLDALTLLGFVEVGNGSVTLTDAGTRFAAAGIQESKELFAEALDRVPLVELVVNALRRAGEGGLRSGFFLDVLRRHFDAEEAEAQLDIAIDWGRYAELFEYDEPHARITVGEATVSDR